MDQLNYYFIANDIATDERKVAVLLSAYGPATFKTTCNLVDAGSLKDIKYDDLVQTLSEHYDPVPSPSYKGTSSTVIMGRMERVSLKL